VRPYRQLSNALQHVQSRRVAAGIDRVVGLFEAARTTPKRRHGVSLDDRSWWDLDEKESWPRLLALDQLSLVELPGIEPEPLPGKIQSELPVRSISIQFSPARYLRFRFRVL